VVPEHSVSTFEDLCAIDPSSGDFSRDCESELPSEGPSTRRDADDRFENERIAHAGRI
jgi:hypothetical protein